MSRYVCPKCGKQSNLPDFCCGQAMAAKGSHVCKTCGAVSSSKKVCCGQEMSQI